MTKPDAAAADRRSSRVAELRAQVEAGTYSVPASEVANAILRHLQLRAKVAPPDPLVCDRLEDGPH